MTDSRATNRAGWRVLSPVGSGLGVWRSCEDYFSLGMSSLRLPLGSDVIVSHSCKSSTLDEAGGLPRVRSQHGLE